MSSSSEARSEQSQESMQESVPGGELDSAALEAALPTLTEKLAALAGDLSDSERQVLSSIVSSSALHLEKLADINAEAEYIYSKPISAAATPEVRSHLMQLPETLGFTESQ
jgi:hypothetical protein